MSESENHHHGKNEIIIIKRHGGGHDDGAHGGAWKIAYADFMTAMMAFFLVMWLVNAANEETKASVATYFNPIKLADEKPTEKGLKKPVDQADGEQTQERSKVSADATTVGAAATSDADQPAATAASASGDNTNYSEADYFENPYSVLAEIAQEVGQQANVSAKGEGGASDSGPATGANGGEAYRDPFDPDFWTQQVEVTRTDAAATPATAAVADTPDPATPQQMAALDTEVAPEKPSDDKLDVDKKPDVKKLTKQEKKEAAAAAELQKAEEKKADELQVAIEKEIGGIAGKLAEGLIVTPAEGGLLVTLSDQAETPMFNIGSSVPRKEMVLAMEKIGKLLEARDGVIVIRGHTDGRQFKGAKNDNWQLSTERAESAYYMLVRGGLAEKRVVQVSGFADRRLQVPENPLADSNRRIEILIQGEQG